MPEGEEVVDTSEIINQDMVVIQEEENNAEEKNRQVVK